MKCSICKTGQLHPGAATVVLERDSATVVIKAVPALVCDNCGEHYVDERTARATQRLASDAVKTGNEVTVLHFVAA